MFLLFIYLASVNPNGGSSPMALRLIACVLLLEITTFMRETYKNLPKLHKIFQKIPNFPKNSKFSKFSQKFQIFQKILNFPKFPKNSKFSKKFQNFPKYPNFPKISKISKISKKKSKFQKFQNCLPSNMCC
jgi:hypothetical protein